MLKGSSFNFMWWVRVKSGALISVLMFFELLPVFKVIEYKLVELASMSFWLERIC